MAAHDSTPHVPAPRLFGTDLLPEPRGAALAPPPGLNSTPDAMSLLKALRRRWLLALSLGVLMAGMAGAAAWFLLPARYTAFALLRVSSTVPGFLDRQEGDAKFATVVRTVAATVKSRQVTMRALAKDDVRHLRLLKKYPDTLSALAWLDENLKVDFGDGSEYITVSLPGEDPNDLVTIVNALVHSYMKILESDEKTQRKTRLEKVKVLYESAKEKLREKEAAKDDLLKRQGANDSYTMQAKQAMSVSQLTHAQSVHDNLQFELAKKNSQLAHLKALKENGAMTPTDIVARDVDIDPQVQQLKTTLQKIEYTIEDLRLNGHPETNSTLRTLVARHASVKKQHLEAVEQVRSELTDKVRQKRGSDIETGIVNLQTETAPLVKQLEKWDEKVKELTKEVESIRYHVAKRDSLDTEIAQEEKNVVRLFDAYKMAQIEEDAEPRVRPTGEAELQNRDTKKRLALLVLIPFAALVGTVLAIAWWEFMARRIHSADEVATSLALRVVGAVPELPDPRRRVGADPQAEEIYRHNLIESIDAIRTMLLRNADAENLRVVMVTSAVGGEGKTTLASNLAMSLARAGRKTLFVDCDLRRPAAHQLFEQTLQPGFSEVVLQEVELPDAVRPTTTDPNLFLLPAGHWDREVIQELAKSGLAGIFEKLRTEFEFIVVDSHPVLPATDSLLLGQHADAVIVSLMRDVSQTHLVHSACQQLSTLGIRVFGAVVNGVPVKVYGKHYQYSTQSAAA